MENVSNWIEFTFKYDFLFSFSRKFEKIETDDVARFFDLFMVEQMLTNFVCDPVTHDQRYIK